MRGWVKHFLGCLGRRGQQECLPCDFFMGLHQGCGIQIQSSNSGGIRKENLRDCNQYPNCNKAVLHQTTISRSVDRT